MRSYAHSWTTELGAQGAQIIVLREVPRSGMNAVYKAGAQAIRTLDRDTIKVAGAISGSSRRLQDVLSQSILR